MPIPISATIICKNAGEKIRLALDSIAWCDAIILVDSGSTDNTLQIVHAHPAAQKITVLANPWPGYNPQRRFAAEKCPTDWLLMLDADEECSPALAQELQSLTDSQLAAVAIFKMPRENYVARRHVRCWGPDYQTRFIHKARVDWDPRSLPEIRTPKPGFTVHKLRHPLLHNRLTPCRPADFNEGVRQAAYAEELALHLRLRGKRASFINLLFRPWMTFLKYYLLRGAIWQGRFGLAIAYKTTIGVMLKYSALYGMELSNTADSAAPETQNAKPQK